MDDQQQAREALATIERHQDRARKAARMPWWVYAAMFVLSAGAAAVNDFVNLTGAKAMALGVMVLLAVVIALRFTGRGNWLDRARGVQRRQRFVPWVFLVVIGVSLFAWKMADHFGPGIVDTVSRAVGLENYPATVTGVLLGALFTLLYYLSQTLQDVAGRRSGA